jgi:6-phosphogluconolactonase (cycloisomerase 2 family)
MAFALGCAAVLASSVLVASTSAGAVTAPVGELYTANYNGATASQFGRNSTGAATALPYPSVPGGSRPTHVVVSPNGKYAYALDCIGGSIHQYTVDPSGLLVGALVPMTPPTSFFGGCLIDPNTPTGHTIAITKTGTFVIVVGVVGGVLNTALVFKASTAGTLTQVAGADIPSESVNAVAITSNNKFFYVTDPQGEIFQYALSTTGTPTLKASIATRPCLTDVAVNPSGKDLYATNDCSNIVDTYSINATTGALTFVGSVLAGSGASSIAIAPNAKTVYVTNATANSVSQYKLATTGLLSALSPASLAVGAKPLGVAVGATSKNVYVSNFTSGTVSEFAITPTSLLLTPTGTVAAGAGAWGIAARK